MRFGATVVFFNPTEGDKENLAGLVKLTEDVVVVDNSPDPNEQWHAELAAQNITVIANRNIGGLARGLNLGIRALLAHGCDVACAFDQDSMVPGNYFDAMRAAAIELGRPDFIIGPVIHVIQLDKSLPAINFSRWKWSLKAVPEELAALTPSSLIITSGTAISRKAFDTVGEYREEFFIEDLDIDLAFRAATAGVPCFIHGGVFMHHSIASATRHAFGLMSYNGIPDRCYYSARNIIAMTRSHARRLPVIVTVNVATAWQVLTIVLFERNKVRKLAATFAGILDGLLGKWGTFAERWPRLGHDLHVPSHTDNTFPSQTPYARIPASQSRKKSWGVFP